MNKEPETYEELLRKKRCINLTNYYELSMDDLEQIYNFLTENKDAIISCKTSNILLLKNKSDNMPLIINTKLKSNYIDGITMSNREFSVINHYSSSSSSSSGGSSSNNSNNNR